MMGIDRISNLPDGVISERILSSMNAKEAVQTCVLSRTWRKLWNDIDILNFDRNAFKPGNSAAFKNFVYHVLNHRQPYNLRRLRFFYRTKEPKLSALIKTVFDYATLHNVMEIETDVTRFPESLHDSQTLRTLKVTSQGYFMLENPLGFKSLTTLHLSEVLISNNCCDILSNCMNLENLDLINCSVRNLKTNSKTFYVKAPRLVNLSIKNLKHIYGNYIKSIETLHVSSPRLRYFKFDGLLPYMPDLLNMRECKALEDVKLNMRDPLVSSETSDWKMEYINYMNYIAEWFVHVKNLTIICDFYWGKFRLFRAGLNKDVKLEEICKDCKAQFTYSNW